MAKRRVGLAFRSLEEVAEIAWRRGLIPTPTKQLVAHYEESAFRKIRESYPELADELCGGGDETSMESRLVEVW